MLRKPLLFLVLVLLGMASHATHMSGGEIYWECIGPNQFRIRLLVYRDCAGINVDPTYNLVLTSPCGNRNLTVSTQGGTEISQLCDLELPNSSCNGGTLPGIQQYEYTGTITLPPCDSWQISWTNIYRNNAIVNLTSPGTRQMYIESVLNSADAPCNDSPTFTNSAIPFVCLGYPVSYSYGAVDSEADSLSYGLIGARMINGTAIPYVVPYTPEEPIDNLTIDPVTGLINFTLNMGGNWVVVVQVTEYDANGNVIGTIMRDMQFVAYPCANIPPDAATGLVTNMSGSATQTGPRALQVCESGDLCFDMVISDPNATNILEAVSNVQQNLPGATFSYTGTNPITASVCWTAQPGTAGFYPIIVNVNDGACPIPAFQTYVYSVEVLTGIAATIQVVDESCAGIANGSAEAIVTAGTGPYSYTWSTGSSESMIMGGAGNYTVDITDANGCTTVDVPAVIGTSGQPNQADAGTDIISCNATAPVALQGSVVNATGGVWSDGSGTFAGAWPNVTYTPAPGEIAVGGVDVVLTTTGNTNCPAATDTVHIDLPNSFIGASTSSTDAACNGADNGTASVVPVDPSFIYAWNDPELQSSSTAVQLTAGTYTVTITDTFGCDTSLTATVDEPQAITLVSLTPVDEACLGSGDGTITAVASGGTAPYTYTWNTGDTGPILTAGSGAYDVSITDAVGCTPATGNASIGALGLPNQADAGVDAVACITTYPVALNGSVTNATGGTWSGGSGTFSGSWPNIDYTPSPAEIGSGSVTLTLTTTGNATCPPATDALVITLPNSFTTSTISSTDAICNGSPTGTATVTPADPAFTYAWNDPAAQNTPTANMLGAGTYSVVITDSFGCDTTLTTTIGQPAYMTVAMSVTPESCLGAGDGTATATPNGGTAPYSYIWGNGTTASSMVGSAGHHTVVVTDANGCAPVVGTVIMNSLGIPNQANAGPDMVVCPDLQPIPLNGTVANATSGSWSGGSGTFSGSWPAFEYTPSTEDVANGGVTFTLTTVGNVTCPPATDTMVLTLPNELLTANITPTDATCYAAATGSATVSPDNGYSYQWNPTGQTTATATGLAAGNHGVIVTDSHGCTVTLNTTIGQPNIIALGNVTATNETCAGDLNGTLTATPIGGTAPYVYTWSNGGNTATITAGAGTYSVSVTDANGCAAANGSGTILATGQPNIADAGADLVGCMNAYPIAVQGAVQNATGGQWSGGTGTIMGTGLSVQYMPTTAEIVNGGVDLTLTTTGNNTCPPATDVVHIALSNSFLQAAISTTNASCNGTPTGTIAFTPQNPEFSYLWNDPQAQTTASAVNLTAGNYTVVVTDGLGCDTTMSATVTEPATLAVAQVSHTDVSCAGGSNGTVALTISGGTPSYAVSWVSGQTSASIGGLQAGTYIANITDAQGCTTQASATVAQPQPIAVSVQAPDTVCVNTPAQLIASATGGAGGYIYNWGGFGFNDTVQLAFPATQTILLTVVDQAGCAGPNTPVTVAVLDLNAADLSTYGDTTVCVGGSATVGASLVNYPGTFSINWSPMGYTGMGPYVVPINADQNILVTVTDACGNSLENTIGLRLDIPPSFELPPMIAEGCAPLHVQFPVMDLGNVVYTWDLGNGTISHVAAPEVIYPQGSYTASLTVTTALGCTSSSSSGGQIIAYGSPVAAFSPSATTVNMDAPSIEFTNQSTGNTITSYAWTFGDGGTSSMMSPTYSFNEIGTFEVELFIEDVHGCTGVSSQLITVEPVYDVVIPDAFTPDPNGGSGGNWVAGDLNNDVFYPFVRFVEEFRMRIFNRWGELIFESNDLNIGWDGYYRGQLSPQDVYVVQTWFKFVDGKKVEKLTDLTLFR
ncbi:MAG TPA: PKD domain-containing protein [Flavobacteriales bacterium]|nr:PKD domain-containing protein [Flavobacteriales bacterium]